MELTKVLLAWSLAASLALSLLVGATPSFALTSANTPVEDQSVHRPEADEPEEDIVLLDDGAFTDTPRVGALPDTGTALDPWLFSLTGALTASLVYLALASQQRYARK